MWKLDHKEDWSLKNWCFRTVVLKTLESPLDSKEMKSVNPKGNQPWIFIGRTDVETEAPIYWLPDVKTLLILTDPDAGKDWKREKAMTEDEMVGASLTQWTWVWVNSRSWWWTEAWCAVVHGVAKSWTRMRDWTDWHQGSSPSFFILIEKHLSWTFPRCWIETNKTAVKTWVTPAPILTSWSPFCYVWLAYGFGGCLEILVEKYQAMCIESDFVLNSQ